MFSLLIHDRSLWLKFMYIYERVKEKSLLKSKEDVRKKQTLTCLFKIFIFLNRSIKCKIWQILKKCKKKSEDLHRNKPWRKKHFFLLKNIYVISKAVEWKVWHRLTCRQHDSKSSAPNNRSILNFHLCAAGAVTLAGRSRIWNIIK